MVMTDSWGAKLLTKEKNIFMSPLFGLWCILVRTKTKSNRFQSSAILLIISKTIFGDPLLWVDILQSAFFLIDNDTEPDKANYFLEKYTNNWFEIIFFFMRAHTINFWETKMCLGDQRTFFWNPRISYKSNETYNDHLPMQTVAELERAIRRRVA